MTAASETASRQIDCPRCKTAMRPLRLSSHRTRPVTVDHCPDCRLVWFDPFESVRLDGYGWVRLLREMEASAKRPLADARVGRPACPQCATTLNAVKNRTRFGLFAALECPQRHGHLHSHSGLLAERGLVRPLGAAERRALAEEKHALYCLNCGGPAKSNDEECSWCGTALVVIDLPRLAHSLRLRLDDMGPSPLVHGRHVAWSCRGCGAALDPGRDESCPHCGHLVVALELPDIDPLLDAAEADLAAAAEADAHRLDRFQSTRRAIPKDEDAAPQVHRERRAPQASLQRTLTLAGWLPLWLVLAAAVAVLGLFLADIDWLRREPAEALQFQRVGDDPGAAWAWVEAHRLIAPGDTRTRTHLREGLFNLYLRQISGNDWPKDATVRTTIALAESGVRTLLDRWQAGLGRSLRVVAADADPAPPPEVAALRGRLSRPATGVWLDEHRYAAIWVPTVENAGPAPLALGRALALRHRVSPVDGVPWRCGPAAGAPPALRPGQRMALVCRSNISINMIERSWSMAMFDLRSAAPLDLAWRDETIGGGRSVDEAIDRLVTDAARDSWRLDRFLRRYTALRDGMPPIAASPAGEPRVPSLTIAQRWQQLPAVNRSVLVLSVLAVALVVRIALARWVGERPAAVALLVAAAPASYLLGRGEGAASVLLVGMYFSLAALLVFVFGFVSRLYGAAVFSRFD
jgi:hypothetical protein